MSSVSFTTLGCRLNQAESDSMAESLAARGVGAPDDGRDPSIVVINTCTVTREATKASRQAIRRAVRDHPEAKVVVIGCYAVSDRAEVEAIDGVDLVLGNDEKEDFAETLSSEAATAPLLGIGFGAPGISRAGTVQASPSSGTVHASPSMGTVHASPSVQVRANLKVQTGCDEWCSFCIIPTTRGPLRSMEADALIAEARRRAAAGAKELVLTGVHLGKFAYDAGGDESALVDLFRRLLDIRGVERLRLSSILSNHLTDEVIAFMASEPRMCRYLHVPLQSGDDGVLAAMNRPYRIDAYMDAIERTKASLPGVALATDIIVGFPGESEEAFQATMDVTRAVGFSKLHVFRFSARRDTVAAEMRDDVHPDIKRRRSKELIALGKEIRERFLTSHLGIPLEVLVEDERVVDGISICSGQTDDYVRVWFEGEGLLGKTVRVIADEIRSDGVRGVLEGHDADTTDLIRIGGRG